jgi:RNA polymerase sigma factor (sigma-70 family)
MQKDRSSELEKAYRENRKGLQAWAVKATRSITDAEDLVQDAFASVMANTESLVDVDDLAAWLFASLRNRVRDFWRRRETHRRIGETAVSDEVIAEIAEAAGLDPAEMAEETELDEALAAAIEALPDEQRSVIEAQVLDGFTFKEIAEMSGISADTLAARKRYAMKRLADSLRDWFDD